MSKESTPGKLPDLLKQLAALQEQVSAVKEREKAEVVARMREAIAVYDITKEELFDKRAYAKRAKPGRPAKRGAAGRAAAKAAVKTGKPARTPARKRRAKRVFDDAQRKDILAQHTKLVLSGIAFDAAAKKMDISNSLLRKWYDTMGIPRPERKVA